MPDDIHLSDDISEALQKLVGEIEDYRPLKDEIFKQQVIRFVRSLNRFDQEYYTPLNNLTAQRADLDSDHINLLILVAIKALKIGDNKVTKNTIKLLDNLENSAKDAIPKLIQLFKETEHKLNREAIAKALPRIGLNNYEEARHLIECVDDPDPEIQTNIIAAISTLREEAAPAIPKLRELLSSNNRVAHPNENENVKVSIISCFGEIGKKVEQADAILLSEYLGPEKSLNIRTAAAQSLARIGSVPKIAITDLIAGLEPPKGLDPEKKARDNLRRISFVEALVKSNEDPEKIILELSHSIEDEALQIQIIQALATINTSSSAEILAKELLKNSDILLSRPLHKMDLGGNWKLKSEIIISTISQDNRSVQSYSNLEFPHLFYAMLPPSEKSISDRHDKTSVEKLCQILIDYALQNQADKNLFDVISKIILIGSRLETKDLKLQIDKYEVSNSNLVPEDLYELRTALGDTSILETEISELNAQLNNSLKNYLQAINEQGAITLSQTQMQFNEIRWMNRFIFGFGFTVGTVSVFYFFYSLFLGTTSIDALKSIISLFGSVAGIGSTFLILFYKPQKQGQEAINNLSKSNVITGGFLFEMAHIAESLARLQSQNILRLDEIRSGSQIIREAYHNALCELQYINKDLSDP